MGRASTWNNRATTPLRIPKVLVKAGTYLFRGIDAFIVSPEKARECFQVTLNDATGCNYLIEMVITRISVMPDVAIATTDSTGESGIDSSTNSENTLNSENIDNDNSSHGRQPEQPSMEDVADIPVGGLLAELVEETEQLTPIEAVTTDEPTEVVAADVEAADDVMADVELDPDFVLLTLDLIEFSNQVYYCWHKLAETIQLPVWGCAIALDDIHKCSFGMMPGELFLEYLHQLIEQEASQQVARIGLVNIPGRQSFTIGTQQVCALTFWDDWYQLPTDVNAQPVKSLFPDPVVQVPLQQDIEQLTELQRLRTVLAQCPESFPETHIAPAPTTIERLRAERQQLLQSPNEGKEDRQSEPVPHPKKSVRKAETIIRDKVKGNGSGLFVGFLGLFQKGTS